MAMSQALRFSSGRDVINSIESLIFSMEDLLWWPLRSRGVGERGEVLHWQAVEVAFRVEESVSKITS